tara:strand:+ start:410 stop:793 length:384 start_codon:yes stop_codon:yes gene_type:complete
LAVACFFGGDYAKSSYGWWQDEELFIYASRQKSCCKSTQSCQEIKKEVTHGKASQRQSQGEGHGKWQTCFLWSGWQSQRRQAKGQSWYTKRQRLLCPICRTDEKASKSCTQPELAIETEPEALAMQR